MSTNQLSEKEREAILKALVSYYTGAAHIAEALNQTPGISKGTYYNRKEQHPDEIKRLHAQAKAIAMRERSGDRIAFEARQVNVSMELQQEAWEVVQGSLDRLRRIATGGAIEIDGRDKPLVIYPRDSNEATRILIQVARGGVLPEHYAVTPPFPAGGNNDGEMKQADMMPLLPINANFSSVTATTPDGTRFTAKVERDGEVVEGEE